MNCYIVKYSNEDEIKENFERNEIENLVFSAGFKNNGLTSYKLKEISSKTHLTSGRITLLKNDIDASYLFNNERVSYLICDFDLTAIQTKNLEYLLQVKVIDRTSLILRIFEINAHTPEAIKQVEIAKLQYLKSHLINNKASYSQITSGSGHNKGVGEKQLELDKRRINNYIFQKKKELAEIKLHRQNSRSRRNNLLIPKIAIVGYTNAGKSTLLNLLVNASNSVNGKTVLSEDKLFATLETSTRLINIYKYPNFLITDTVGFIKDLPTFLIDAFKSTLEEIKEADILIHVVDISSPLYKENIQTTNKILNELGIDNIPIIYLYNKYDLKKDGYPYILKQNELLTSFKSSDDIDEILKSIFLTFTRNWKKIEMHVPYDEINWYYKNHYIYSQIEKNGGFDCVIFKNPLIN